MPTAAREILAGWHWVSLKDPPAWLQAVSGLATLLFEAWLLLVLFVPSRGGGPWAEAHRWLDRHSYVAFLGLIMGWSVVYWLVAAAGCIVANTALFLGRLLCFPILVILRGGCRAVGGYRVLGCMLDALDGWLAPDDTIRLYRRVMPHIGTLDAIEWTELSPAQTVSRLLELRGDELLGCLPARVWPELITADLSPDAMGILFCRTLRHDSTMFRAVASAVVSQDWFSHPDRGPLLGRELAALPADELATTLEMISELSRFRARHTMHGILAGVQKLDDTAAVRRFQVAMTYASSQVCVDLFVCKEPWPGNV